MRICHLWPEGRAESVDDLGSGLVAARDAGGFVWAEVDHPAIGDFVEIERVLGLHPLAVEDAVNARERPKLDNYDGRHFFTLITLGYRGPATPLEVGRVMAFVGDDFIVTVRQEAGDTLERARRRLTQAGHKPLSSHGALHAVLDTVVDDLADVSRSVEESILAAAERLFGAEGSDEASVLYGTTVQLLAMAHAVQPLIEPLRHLSTGVLEGVEVETARRFQDVLDHALVVDREVRDHSELVEHLRDSNDSRIALRQNSDMRKIAAWAAVIAVPTAITSFYGMNVPYPGFGETTGVLTAVALQGLLAVTLFVLLRRRGWL